MEFSAAVNKLLKMIETTEGLRLVWFYKPTGKWGNIFHNTDMTKLELKAKSFGWITAVHTTMVNSPLVGEVPTTWKASRTVEVINLLMKCAICNRYASRADSVSLCQ